MPSRSVLTSVMLFRNGGRCSFCGTFLVLKCFVRVQSFQLDFNQNLWVKVVVYILWRVIRRENMNKFCQACLRDSLFAFNKFVFSHRISFRLFHRLAYTHKLAETLDSQLVHYITTKCVLYMQLLQIKIVRQKVTVTHWLTIYFYGLLKEYFSWFWNKLSDN